MPADYLAMKKKFQGQGLSLKAAEKKAARIHNSNHPDNPVGRGEHQKKRDPREVKWH